MHTLRELTGVVMAAVDDDDPNLTPVFFTLRTRQIQYLEYLAERDGEAFSHSLAKVIIWANQNLMLDPPARIEKIRKHVLIPESCLKFVDQFAASWGLTRTDVVRRLVDDAMARDNTI